MTHSLDTHILKVGWNAEEKNNTAVTKDGKDCVNPLFTANNTAAAYDAADSLHYKHKRENVTSTKVIVTSSNVYYTLRDRFNDLTFIQHIPTKIKRVL